jgi:hypothetical protein
MKQSARHHQASRGDTLVTGLYVAAGVVLLLVVAMTSGLADVSEAAADAVRAPVAASSATPSPSTSPSATLTTSVTRDVTLHRGQYASVFYRADDSAGGSATVDLLVTTRDGRVVRRLVTGRTVPVGATQKWRGRLRLRSGPYLLVAHAVDASGRAEASAQLARLRVLAQLPALVPTARARRAAFAWAARRAGDVAVAVVDSRGHLYGYHAERPFITASLVKAMLLVAYLRRHSTVPAGTRATLTSMITVSDNDAADAIYASVGRTGLRSLARLAGMTSFRVSGAWITCRVDAADMARFFRDMQRYVPRRHRRFADGLLTHIVSYQSWGIPAAARPLGYRVYFKAGWLGAWTLASQAARVEDGRVRLGIAVFTDGNAPGSYGKETVAGVTERLLRR